jgi:alkanesulfonate monooxygenase SsuD/methylene tetrahydromethanopterin reductase-like flavin-dependent oxidoreductase (luciferase family)
MVERARAARLADLDSLFVGDHHVTPTNYYQNTPILGRMLAEWGNKPAGALYLLPLWNPVLLAEQVATLACIAQGPFILQCGLGGERHQSLGMGVDPARRVGMFETALGALRALWGGEEVTLERYWPIERARIAPLPPEPVEVWIGADAPAAVDRTARLGDGWLASPSLDGAQARDGLNRYRQACAEHGRDPSAVAIRRDVFIGATAEEARRVVEPYIAAGYRGFPPEALVYGSVEQVAGRFRDLADLGYTDVIVRNISARQDESLATIERLAEVRRLVGTQRS